MTSMDEDEGIPISNDLIVSTKSIDFDLRHNPFLLPRGADNGGQIFSDRESALDLPVAIVPLHGSRLPMYRCVATPVGADDYPN